MRTALALFVVLAVLGCNEEPEYRDYLQRAESPQECSFDDMKTAAVFVRWRLADSCDEEPPEFIGCMDMTVAEPWRPINNTDIGQTTDVKCESCMERADGATFCARHTTCFSDVSIEEEAAFRWIRNAAVLGRTELAGSAAWSCYQDEFRQR